MEAAKNAPHMDEKYPIRWLQFQKALVEEVSRGQTLHDFRRGKCFGSNKYATCSELPEVISYTFHACRSQTELTLPKYAKIPREHYYE